jgi:hypothetical protein
MHKIVNKYKMYLQPVSTLYLIAHVIHNATGRDQQ